MESPSRRGHPPTTFVRYKLLKILTGKTNLKRHDARDMLNQARDREDHFICGTALLELAVDLDPQVQVLRVRYLLLRDEVTA